MSEKMLEGYKPGQLSSEVRAMAERDINAGPFPSLSLIADTHEDEGQSEIASGYRWLINHRRFPRPDGGTNSDFYWIFTHDESTLYKTEFYLPADLATLMNAVSIEVSGANKPPLCNHFFSLSDAYRTAAICLGAHFNQKKYDSAVMLLTFQEQLWYRIPDVLKPYFNSLSVPIPSLEARIERRKKEVDRTVFLEQRDIRDRAERIARSLKNDFEKQMRLGLPLTYNACSEIPPAEPSTFELTYNALMNELIQRLDLKGNDPRIFIDPKNIF